MKCRICGSKDTRRIFQSERCPKASHKFSESVATAYSKITAYRCAACETVQLDKPYQEHYSEDYQRNNSFSKSASAFMKKNAAAFGSCFKDARGKKILEIGCGDGTFLRMLQDGFETYGIEPSRAAQKLAKGKGLNVINGYFDPALFKVKFDGVVARFVLEHIFDINGFLKDLRPILNDGAKLEIELPNFSKMAGTARYYEFFNEHVFYFDAHSIVNLMRRHGFNLLKYDTFMDDEYFMAIFEYGECPENQFEKKRGEINQAFAGMLSDAKRVAFWGAGGGGVSLISYSNIDKNKIGFIVDSDPNKHGLYTYGTSLRIVPPATLLSEKNVDAVIILSPTYEEEIARELRNKFRFKGKIGSVKGIPHWIN